MRRGSSQHLSGRAARPARTGLSGLQLTVPGPHVAPGRTAKTLEGMERRHGVGVHLRRAAWGRGLPVCVALLVSVAPLRAQQLHGTVLDAEDERPVPQALVRLVDDAGKDHAAGIADSAGVYTLAIPSSGEYRIAAERVGFEPFRSLLLAMDATRSYPVDIELERSPVPIPGLVVTGRRFEELERGIHLLIGQNPRSLRNPPMLRPTIEEHLAKGHNVSDLVRWSNAPSIVTRETGDGPCFQWRNRGCLPVFLNGAVVRSDLVPDLPLDMLEAVVLLGVGESIAYPGGAVLLYTPGWIR